MLSAQKFGRLLADAIKEGIWRLSDRSKPIVQTQPRVQASKGVLGKQYRAATLIGMVCLVGTIPMLLVSPGSMQCLRRKCVEEVANRFRAMQRPALSWPSRQNPRYSAI